MKKLLFLFSLLLCVFYSHSQLNTIEADARSYNNTWIIPNSQIKADRLNTLVNKVLNGFKFIDTSGRFNIIGLSDGLKADITVATSGTKFYLNNYGYNIVTRSGADTTGVTDASAIVQSAINAGWKLIVIPAGTFKWTNTVQLKDGITISGQGATTVLQLSTNIQAFKVSEALGGNRAVIQDLTIRGSKLSGASTAQEGIRLDSAYGFSAINVRPRNIGGAGFHFMKNGYCCGTYTQTGMRGNFIINPYADSCKWGVVFDSTAEYNRVLGGSLVNNDYGYRNWRAGNNSLLGVDISANVHGIQVIGGGGTNDGHSTFTDCIINHNIEPIYIDSIARGLYFSNCMIYGQGYDSARIKNSDRITFTGGYFTPTKLLWENNTNSSINGVSDLLGIATGWTIVGTRPTIFELDDAQRINKPLNYSYNFHGEYGSNSLIDKSYYDSVKLIAKDTVISTNTRTANYTITISDQYHTNIKMNVGSANTVTIPPNSSSAFPIGTIIYGYQYGAGQTTIIPGAGVTLRNPDGYFKTRLQYSDFSMEKIGTDEWLILGDLAL